MHRTHTLVDRGIQIRRNRVGDFRIVLNDGKRLFRFLHNTRTALRRKIKQDRCHDKQKYTRHDPRHRVFNSRDGLGAESHEYDRNNGKRHCEIDDNRLHKIGSCHR